MASDQNLRNGDKEKEMLAKDVQEIFQRAHAESLDKGDPLQHLRREFLVPTKADLKRETLARSAGESLEEAIYLCGNSLGLQPCRTRELVDSFLSAWATKNVYGHFVGHKDSSLAPFLHVDDEAAKLMAPIVGAEEDEVAVMGTLTANLHMLMAAFYKPTKERYKIILEGKAFPSDHVCNFDSIKTNSDKTKRVVRCRISNPLQWIQACRRHDSYRIRFLEPPN